MRPGAGVRLATLLNAPVAESNGGKAKSPSAGGMTLFKYGPIAARESRPYSWAKAAGCPAAKRRNVQGTKLKRHSNRVISWESLKPSRKPGKLPRDLHRRCVI